MAAVSESLVREYFELHGFFVRQNRKYIAHTKREEDDIDFFVLNPQPQLAPAQTPFVLETGHLSTIERAIVVVKGWHSNIFSPARLTSAPRIFRFAGGKLFQEATRLFGGEHPPTKILVAPSLPPNALARDKSIDLLRANGVDAVILFHTILADLITLTEVNRDYQKSDLLQVIRILKNYDFFKPAQMELFKRSGQKR